MGCGPSKKRVELQQYYREETDRFLNEFSRDLDDRLEKRKRDALDAKAAAERVGTIIDRLLAGRVTAKALGSERQASHEVKRTWVMSE